MGPIDPLGPLLAQIRAQAQAWKEKTPARRAGERDAEPEADAAPPPEDVLARTVSAVAAIPADLPDRRRRAFRLYLQAVLARELGIQDPDGPGFQGLVERVLTAMEDQEGLPDAIARAGDLLLERAQLGVR
jgi:hypothetical protein